MLDFPKDVEFFVDWHLTNRCNFSCAYCHPQIRRVLNTNIGIEHKPHLVADQFNNLELTCGILLSGGEPFLYPDFTELCKLLTNRHYIKINSNLSIRRQIVEFAASVDAMRVTQIVAALHVSERERLNQPLSLFAENYRLLKERCFNVVALYVLYPPLLNRAKEDISQLKDLGVDLIAAKVFKGVYEKKRYPEGYTDFEKEQIEALSGSYPNNKDYLESPLSFKGFLCNAGCNSVKITVTGDVYRCASVQNDKLGNIFNGTFQVADHAKPCPASRILALSECKRNIVDKL